MLPPGALCHTKGLGQAEANRAVRESKHWRSYERRPKKKDEEEGFVTNRLAADWQQHVLQNRMSGAECI
jgi:uncharacterized protein YqcC (DUF446 family)